ncbi:RES family NAD+ phosphorylase [Methylococcus sp. EFPC2]|uniref:RES family NAD+ phosphorylase n=1 Tax=Methylococcus sp. EFPC2 TaxID=2812648 RepID=UPI0019687A3B|nr:RES family NAD+ phosphorylase [Methylococcus sp. EFPC2]QSA95719.1 RES family NAD+ phosphorylase [Methylococcus sp. EFPC2]
MSAGIWSACAGADSCVPLEGSLFRIVESQVQIATHRLVSTLEEQALLEELLETAKPPLAAGTASLHYLLATPFRYPPLRHGSRFGRRHEPSLFYGSLAVDTVLAEAAYYRLVFWQGMEVAPKAPLATQHTMFEARYACRRGVRLHQPPFDAWRAELVHPASYVATQALGSEMRAAGVEAFEFTSARHPEGGVNVALFTPSALASRRPESTQNWQAETIGDHVSFYSPEQAAFHGFELSIFLVDGKLPIPAG